MEPVGLGRLGLAVVASDKGGQGGAGPATRRKICKALPSFFTSLNHLYINLHCVDLIPSIKESLLLQKGNSVRFVWFGLVWKTLNPQQ